MRDLSIKELIDLASSDVSDAESRIEKVFEWHFKRVITISQWSLGLSTSILVATFITFFNLKAEPQNGYWFMIIFIFIALLTNAYGVYRLWELRSLNHQFIAAVRLFYDLKRISPFLVKYRDKY